MTDAPERYDVINGRMDRQPLGPWVHYGDYERAMQWATEQHRATDQYAARIAALEAENAAMTQAYAATYRALYGLPDDVFTPEMFGAVGDGPPPLTLVERQAQQVAALEADLARARERVEALERERDAAWEAGRDAAADRYADNYRSADGTTDAIAWDWFKDADTAIRALKPAP